MQLHTTHILYSTDYVLSLQNIITCLFIHLCRDQVLLPPPFGTTSRFGSVMMGLSDILSLLLYSYKWHTIYLADLLPPPPPPAMSQCLDCCSGVIFDIYYNIIYSNPTDICFMNYRLIICMLSFSYLSLYFNRTIGTVVVVIVW